MERQDFLPRTVLTGDNGLRDLPPADRVLTEPTPRPEQLLQGSGEGSCGCSCDGGHHNGGRHNGGHHHGDDHHHGACGVCYGHEGCGEGSWGLCDYPLAMVYAPCQIFRALYDPATALNRGTLFTELDLPFGSTEGAFTAEGCACRLDRGERRRS